ncbi:hypothetical protein D3C71_1904530 [compost metagenome]
MEVVNQRFEPGQFCVVPENQIVDALLFVFEQFLIVFEQGIQALPFGVTGLRLPFGGVQGNQFRPALA